MNILDIINEAAVDSAKEVRYKNWVAQKSNWIQNPGYKRKDPNILKIQQLLISLDPPYDVGPSGADGVRGPYTTSAIKQFQLDNGLRATGRPSNETINLMNRLASNVKPAEKIPANKNTLVVPRSQVASYLETIPGLTGKENHKTGILANIQGESDFRPAVLGDKGTSGGLFQHHASRFKALVKAVPDWKTNWKGQIEFALAEPEAQGYTTTNFKTPVDAITWWVTNFEKTKNPAAAIASRSKFV